MIAVLLTEANGEVATIDLPDNQRAPLVLTYGTRVFAAQPAQIVGHFLGTEGGLTPLRYIETTPHHVPEPVPALRMVKYRARVRIGGEAVVEFSYTRGSDQGALEFAAMRAVAKVLRGEVPAADVTGEVTDLNGTEVINIEAL